MKLVEREIYHALKGYVHNHYLYTFGTQRNHVNFHHDEQLYLLENKALMKMQIKKHK